MADVAKICRRLNYLSLFTFVTLHIYSKMDNSLPYPIENYNIWENGEMSLSIVWFHVRALDY